MKKEFTQEEVKQIISNYTQEHMSMANVGKQFAVSKTVIRRVLTENNIPIKGTNHKYYADYNKFQVIDSAEKAYWLGFLAADGCVYDRGQNASVIINIHQQDKEHIEKFATFIETNARIVEHIQTGGYSNNTPMVKISLNSIKLVQDLVDKGVCPRKSLVLKPPKIDEKFWLPYILGYFDGDGSIFATQQGIWGINIEGTKETLEWINSILNISERLEKRQQDDKNNYYIRCGGTDKPYEILKKLYSSCNTHLNRKFDRFKELETVVLNRNIK